MVQMLPDLLVKFDKIRRKAAADPAAQQPAQPKKGLAARIERLQGPREAC